ncbi:hypothetical protein PROFUN_14659 [Planoprotostelium fungivorum]|uniref:Uncharacterized protein n=1 Tax=Planoprotostelium fungivorum TaxID=1890364 RepID=A0A2P6MMS6_9EUKA|nr:hypothetical protein PROFUN_14659 [Planoprotostelium fungivorum]
MAQWWSSAYNDIVSQLPQSIVDHLKLRIQNTKIRDKKCELNEESDNLKGLFEKELASYNNKKQCMKDLIEEKEKEHKAEMKRLQIECKNKTMSLEVQLEETQKELENKIEFIRKQMISPVRFADANSENKNRQTAQPALTPWQKGSGDER